MCMARFETGASGNAHFHGFPIGAGGPRLGRVRGDVAADPQDDRAPDSDDDGVDPDEVAREEPTLPDDDLSQGEAEARDEGELVPPPPEPAAEARPKRRKRTLKLSETFRPLPDNRQEHNAHVQSQRDMERVLGETFGDLVSE